jgi:hypothetical protein
MWFSPACGRSARPGGQVSLLPGLGVGKSSTGAIGARADALTKIGIARGNFDSGTGWLIIELALAKSLLGLLASMTVGPAAEAGSRSQSIRPRRYRRIKPA